MLVSEEDYNSFIVNRRIFDEDPEVDIWFAWFMVIFCVINAGLASGLTQVNKIYF